MMGAQKDEGAERVRAPQSEWFPAIFGQRLRDEEVTPDPIRETESGGDPEWQPRTDVAKGPTYRRSKNKPEPKRHPNHPKRPRAFFPWHHISDVSHRGRHAR